MLVQEGKKVPPGRLRLCAGMVYPQPEVALGIRQLAATNRQPRALMIHLYQLFTTGEATQTDQNYVPSATSTHMMKEGQTSTSVPASCQKPTSCATKSNKLVWSTQT